MQDLLPNLDTWLLEEFNSLWAVGLEGLSFLLAVGKRPLSAPCHMDLLYCSSQCGSWLPQNKGVSEGPRWKSVFL